MLPIHRLMSSWSRLPIPRDRLTFDLSVYLVANRPSFRDENLFLSKIISAVKGGVSCVQFRDHKSALAATIKMALRLKNMLQAIGVLNLSYVGPVYRELRFDVAIAMAGGLMGEEAPNVTIQKIQDIGQKIRGER